MNHYAARQATDGKWYYTMLGRYGISRLGKCADWVRCECAYTVNQSECKICGGKGTLPNESPCPGHDTAEEARQHYKESLVENCTFHANTKEWPKYKCRFDGCNEVGVQFVLTGMDGMFYLCDLHANRESVGQFITVGECWVS